MYINNEELRCPMCNSPVAYLKQYETKPRGDGIVKVELMFECESCGAFTSSVCNKIDAVKVLTRFLRHRV